MLCRGNRGPYSGSGTGLGPPTRAPSQRARAVRGSRCMGAGQTGSYKRDFIRTTPCFSGARLGGAPVQVVSRSSDIGPGVKSGVKSGVSIHLVWDLYSYKIHAGHLLRFFIVIKHTIEICYMCMINIYCSMEFQTVSTSCTRNLYKMY